MLMNIVKEMINKLAVCEKTVFQGNYRMKWCTPSFMNVYVKKIYSKLNLNSSIDCIHWMDPATWISRLRNSLLIRGFRFTDIFRIMNAVSFLISMELPGVLGFQDVEQNLSLTLLEKNGPVCLYFQTISILNFQELTSLQWNSRAVESKIRKCSYILLQNTLQVSLVIEAVIAKNDSEVWTECWNIFISIIFLLDLTVQHFY